MTDQPCPFCQSEDLIRSSLYVDEGTELIEADDTGEIPTVSCRLCLAESPVQVWNNRPSPWRFPPDMPEEGQRIVHTYAHPDHGESDPVTTVYWRGHYSVHCHPLLRWWPVPEVGE